MVVFEKSAVLDSRSSAGKALIAPVVVGWRFAKNGWLLPSDAKPHGAKRFIV
jgi:hypothetical protein